MDDVRLEAEVAGRPVAAPIVLTGPAAGAACGAKLNRELAAIAERHGLAFTVAWASATLDDNALREAFELRARAQTVPMLAMLPLGAAVEAGPEAVVSLMHDMEADAMILQLDPLLELTRRGSRCDFRGALAALRTLARLLGDALIVKESGGGIAGDVARRLSDAGVRALDVAGAGGTGPWVDWGIPTAAATALARRAADPDVTIIGSGGIADGLDAARAIVLGADLVSVGSAVLETLSGAGEVAADRVVGEIVDGLRAALLMTGCVEVEDLQRHRAVVTGELRDWLTH